MNEQMPPAVTGPVEPTVRPRPTHWKDDRGYVLTDAQREARGFDWQQAYNVPCKAGAFGRIVPLHKCAHCGGKGRDPESPYDACPYCGKSGGVPGPNVEANLPTRAKGT